MPLRISAGCAARKIFTWLEMLNMIAVARFPGLLRVWHDRNPGPHEHGGHAATGSRSCFLCKRMVPRHAPKRSSSDAQHPLAWRLLTCRVAKEYGATHRMKAPTSPRAGRTAAPI